MKEIFSKVFYGIAVMAMLLNSTVVYAIDMSNKLDADNITITNNSDKADTVYISGLLVGDLVKVYDSISAVKPLGAAVVSTNKYDTTINIPQIGTTEGKLYISVTNSGMTESERVEVNYDEEYVSEKLSASSVNIVNSANMADVIYIDGVSPGDSIRVYDSEYGGRLIGSTTVAGSRYDATININQIGSLAGTVYIAVKTSGMLESERTAVNYDGEEKTDKLSADDVTITNIAGKADTVDVQSLTPSDIVKVYNALTAGKLLGSATAKDSTATVSISQIGSVAGSAYVSVTSKGKQESERIKVDYYAEPKSEGLDENKITVTNNASSVDTIQITSLFPGDVIRAYDQTTLGKLLGSATVANGKTEATISVKQLGTTEGSVYVSVAGVGELESERVEVSYIAEPISEKPDTENITVTNNGTIADTVYVESLSIGDTIKVYDSSIGGKLLGSAIVGNGKTDATVTIKQLGTIEGSVFVSITSKGATESDRVEATYEAEPKSSSLNASDIVVTNNGTLADTIDVDYLNPGDTINVYNAATAGKLIGKGTIASGKTAVTITIKQLGATAGSVYVTLTQIGKSESDRVKVDYDSEPKSDTLDTSDIVITNNGTVADTVEVTYLNEGDIVKIYNAETAGKLLGSATVASGKTGVTITIKQIGATAGSAYLTLTQKGKVESDRVKNDYDSEPKSEPLNASDIEITNNGVTSDTVEIQSLNAGDIVNVYNELGKLLGKGTVATGKTDVTITIKQIGTEAGSAYISVIRKGELESDKVKIDYDAEVKSEKVSIDDVEIINNGIGSDTVEVQSLDSGDVVKVYNALTGGKVLGTATVATDKTDVKITIKQLGTAAGSAYIAVTNKGRVESERVKVDYDSEPKTDVLDDNDIVINNNGIISDTIEILSLEPEDVVKVYSAASGGKVLGLATVAVDKNDATITIKQLGSVAGSVYITLTNKNKLESDRKKFDFGAEESSTAPFNEKVYIVNNFGIAGTVTVAGLRSNDLVKAYSTETGATVIGTGTVAEYETEVTIPVTKLADLGGSVYISVTSKGLLESTRTKADYLAKLTSVAPSIEKVKVQNNLGIACTAEVTGLNAGDVVKVYSAVSGGTLLGTGTVAANSIKVIVELQDLDVNGGSVYVSIKNVGKSESERAKVDYSAKGKSDVLIAKNVDITNNSNAYDTIDVVGLSPKDVVSVYNALTGGNMLVSGTVADDSTEVELSIKQLGTAAGKIYISVTSLGKIESDRVEVAFDAEAEGIDSTNVTIVNNKGTASTITVDSLTSNDLVKVYNAAAGGTLIGSGRVASGSTQVTIKTTQLLENGGSVYISVTSYDGNETGRIKIDYQAVQISDPIYAGNVTIVNNTGAYDTITVVDLNEKDLVKVYDSDLGGNLLGTATVPSNSNQVVIRVSQLGSYAGSVYVSITKVGYTESDRTEVEYIAEIEE